VYSYAAVSVFLVSQIGGLIIPFTFLNSFFQNRLLETESALRKRVRYIGVTLIMLILYLSTIFVIGRVWINMFDVTDPTLIIILVLFVSLTFTPINKKILKVLDEKFYPERTKYTDSLKKFIQNIAGYIESDELLDRLSEWAVSTTGISKAIPVVAGIDSTQSLPFHVKNSNSVLNRIKDGSKFYWDEINDRSRFKVDNDEFDWAFQNDISVTIPMLYRGELIGALNVGRKVHEDDFSVEDLDILTQASNQTALALQNIKLQSENIDKKRMDKELEMARNIQKRLMPQDIPVVPGIDVTGECHPCYEIAGDYFDIINIEGGYSVMVVADVSGKGAGAAMIMANLQASIRLGVHLSDKLSDFVARINELIYNNTSASEFITFFMGIWEPAKNVLYYVNAGHNPPVVIDEKGKVIRLDATGLMLGVLPDSTYEEKYLIMNPGSVFVIYTDGLEEAMNDKDEMFGGDRIISTVEENKSLSPEKILQSLRDSVLAHCGSRPIQDDVTMIVGKVK
ncbi:MAG: GAF domain-containing SpoIIE family protein phosphatase, partial [Ignavibacteria bacterium]